MQITFSRDEMREMVRVIVAEMLDQFGGDPEVLSYTEAEAARLLGVKPHVLRDARYRGQIAAAKLGKAYLYQRADLVAFLQDRKGE